MWKEHPRGKRIIDCYFGEALLFKQVCTLKNNKENIMLNWIFKMAFKLEKLFILNQSYFFPLMLFSLLKQSSKNVPTVSIGWCKSFCIVLIFLARHAKKTLPLCQCCWNADSAGSYRLYHSTLGDWYCKLLKLILLAILLGKGS